MSGGRPALRRPLGRGLALGAALALTAGACAREESAPSPGEEVLATVEGEVVTVDEFRRSLERRGSRLREQASTPAQREARLEELIRFQVLAANARKAGYDEDPEVVAAMQRLMVRRFEQDQLEARLEGLAVTDAEVQAYYDEHRADEFTVPEAVRAGVIFVNVPPGASEEKRQELAERAEEARAEAAQDAAEGFAAVATRYSDDQPTRYRGGDAGWLAREDRTPRWEPAVLEAAFALSEPGELAPLVEGEQGFYVVRLVERRASQVRPLEQVREAIRARLLRERRDALERDFYAEMRRNVKVEINRELLEGLELADVGPADEGRRRPPRLPTEQVE